MDFIEVLKALSAKIQKQMDDTLTEEATKTAFVLPFLSALDYDIFDPFEVIPEFTADVGIKKGEKVDYAIMKDSKPIILVECKKCNANLDSENYGQLFRYFSTTEVRFCILTNGIVYRFYTDLEKPNQMDTKPFMELNMLDIQDSLVEELKKLTKQNFHLETMLNVATELKYTREIKLVLEEQLSNPSDEFIRFFTSFVYSGTKTSSVMQQFKEIVKRALGQFINEQINKRLKCAMSEEKPIEKSPDEQKDNKCSEHMIITTEEELEGFYIVKSILRDIVDSKRIIHRDTQSYFGVLLDDNNRKPVCRLHFNSAKKYMTLFDRDKKENKILMENLDDIYKYTSELRKTITFYENKIETIEKK
ncbi:type I restriction endonuclease [Candidatus Magnetomonas plexicatena]|uniref:type I restriction endonuclease n=1 Tax=Candidatus Magnetomonas plexicatena TaxID=2552947 RepID=UPI001C787AE2|nr:restriction endonuclease [Nitrospirales bacterium LBB_01]